MRARSFASPKLPTLALTLTLAHALSLAAGHDAAACPCLTPVGSQADEASQRALLLVADEGLDYVLQLEVIGDAAELGWLIPTPAVAHPPVLAEPDLFDRLEEGTAPLLIGCGEAGGCAGEAVPDDARQGGLDVWSQGQLEQLEYAVLSAADGADLQAWLRNHGYPVDDHAQAVIDAYVAEGWAFVALRVGSAALEATRSVLGPVRVHVPYADEPIFPLRLSALSSRGRTSLVLYIAAPEPLLPTSYPLVAVDSDRLEQDAGGGSNYPELLREAIDAEERGFVVEYVGPEPALSARDRLLDGALEGLQLVRLHADLPPTALTLDLTLGQGDGAETPAYPCVPTDAGAEEGGCAAAGGALGPWSPTLLLGLLVLGALRRRRRRAC